jgi:hypothetical protein
VDEIEARAVRPGRALGREDGEGDIGVAGLEARDGDVLMVKVWLGLEDAVDPEGVVDLLETCEVEDFWELVFHGVDARLEERVVCRAEGLWPR